MRWASALRCPWLVIGSVPPVDSMTISAQKIPVLMCTEATFEMGMLSSLLPNRRDLVRITRCGLTTILVGKKKLPWVQRLAEKVSAGEESIALRAASAIALILVNQSMTFGLEHFPQGLRPTRNKKALSQR